MKIRIIKLLAVTAVILAVIGCNIGPELVDEIALLEPMATPNSSSGSVDISYKLQNNTIYNAISMTVYYDVDFVDIIETHVEMVDGYFPIGDIFPVDTITFSCSDWGQTWTDLQGISIDKIVIVPEDDLTEEITVSLTGDNSLLFVK